MKIKAKIDRMVNSGNVKAIVWQFPAWSTLCGELQLPYELGAGGEGEEE